MSTKTLAFFIALMLCGCGDNKPPNPGNNPGNNTDVTPPPGRDDSDPSEIYQPPANAVTVKGVVTFKGTPPRRRNIGVDSDKHCAEHYKDHPLLDEEVIVKDGKLANVYVYIKNPPRFKYQPPATPVDFDQNGCHYVPHVFGIQVGQQLRIKNSDATTHNIHKLAGPNAEFNHGQSSGDPPIIKVFSVPAVGEKCERFKCDIHGWMNAYMHVSKHPFFSVSGEDGALEIRGLPPGEYEFTAWHERLGTKTKKLKLPEDADKLTFEYEKQ